MEEASLGNESANISCPSPPPGLARPDLAALYIYGYSSVVLIGTVANALSLMVLGREKSRTTTRIFLLSLACADTAILITYLCNYSLRTIVELEQIETLFPLLENEQYIYWASNFVKLIQVWLILAISADRYFAIHYPLRAPKVCTVRNAKVTCAVIVVSSVVFNLPRVLRYSRIAAFDKCLNMTVFVFESQEILSDTFITVYWDVADPVMYYFVPLLSLVTLNFLLIREVKKANAVRERMSSQSKQENNVTCTLVAIVSNFIVCESPTVALYGFELCYGITKDRNGVCFLLVYKDETAVAVSSFLLLVNSSINFFLYILIGKKFRRLFLELCCGMKKRLSVPAVTFTDSARTSNALLASHHNGLHKHSHSSGMLSAEADNHAHLQRFHRYSADIRLVSTNAC